jgi:hypothetical protein
MLVKSVTHFEKLIGAVTGDVHCAHPRVSTDRIIHALENLFLKTVSKANVNFICINGDFYDRLCIDTDEDKLKSQSFFTKLLLYCRSKNICLRLLKGTPSHDHDQLKGLEAIANGIEGVDFKYIDTVYVENNKRFGINILYVPDEWRHRCSDTFTDCKEVIHLAGLREVDYAFIHGQFDYQLGDIVPDRLKHKVSDFKTIVNKKVFCNHIHTYSNNDLVIAPGSIERLSQSEQDDKGFVIFKDHLNGCDCDFIVNTHATKHHTVIVSDMGIEEAVDYIYSKINKLKMDEGDCLRIRCSKNSPIKHAESELQLKWPHIRISVEYKADKKEALKIVKPMVHEQMTINAQTVPDLLFKQMKILGVEPDILQKAKELIDAELAA